jgi:hypothetical protein
MDKHVKITTNYHWRELVAFDQLPVEARKDFDYVTGEDEFSPRFVQYRNRWYDTTDCDGLARNIGITDWDLYQSDSFYSGVVFRWPVIEDDRGRVETRYDYDSVVVGTYIS